MHTKKLSSALVKVGWLSLILGFGLLIFIYWPVAKVEVNYRVGTSQVELQPVDTDFGIVIPKIGANAKVIAKVDPYNSLVYQRALTQGVAHAKTSSLPGQPGNVFIFSHSSVNFYEASRYNSIFYLLNKLEPGDEIRVYYQGQPVTYRVSETKIVSSSAVNYLQAGTGEPSLTLMTCWPAGTTYKRLIIIARPVLR